MVLKYFIVYSIADLSLALRCTPSHPQLLDCELSWFKNVQLQLMAAELVNGRLLDGTVAEDLDSDWVIMLPIVIQLLFCCQFLIDMQQGCWQFLDEQLLLG